MRSTCFKIEALVDLIKGCVVQVLAECRIDCSAIQIWISCLKTALDEQCWNASSYKAEMVTPDEQDLLGNWVRTDR